MDKLQIDKMHANIVSNFIEFSKHIGKYAYETKKDKDKVRSYVSSMWCELNKILYM